MMTVVAMKQPSSIRRCTGIGSLFIVTLFMVVLLVQLPVEGSTSTSRSSTTAAAGRRPDSVGGIGRGGGTAEPATAHGFSSIRAESALVDGETGRIYWETGGLLFSSAHSTRTASISPQLRRYNLHVPHFRAVILTALLWMAVCGRASPYVEHKLHSLPFSSFVVGSPKFYYALLLSFANEALLYAPRVHTWLLTIIVGLYLWESYTCTTRQYLSNTIQASSCAIATTTTNTTTTNILNNSTSPRLLDDLTGRIRCHNSFEQYMERLRATSPVVEWTVRSYHYQEPAASWMVMEVARLVQRVRDRFMALVQYLSSQLPPLDRWTAVAHHLSLHLPPAVRLFLPPPPPPPSQRQGQQQQQSSVTISAPSDSADGATTAGLRKRFTTKARATYRYGGTTDRTVAEVVVDKKQQRPVKLKSAHGPAEAGPNDDKATTSTSGTEPSLPQGRRPKWTPMAKVTLTQLLVLAYGKARVDYFQQQSRFVTRHCRDDPFLEFTTNLRIAGFRPRLLVLRPPPPPLPLPGTATATATTTTTTLTTTANATNLDDLWGAAAAAASVAAANVTNTTAVVFAASAAAAAASGTAASVAAAATAAATTATVITVAVSASAVASIKAAATQISIRITQWMCSIIAFWFFTLLGLTVPYRIWFSQQCDEIRVWVLKETQANTERTSSSSAVTPPPPPPAQPLLLLPPAGPLPSQSKKRTRPRHGHRTNDNGDNFRSLMHSFRLYGDDGTKVH